MNGTIHVLSVGIEEPVHGASMVDVEQHHWAVSVVKDFCVLFRPPANRSCDLGVLQAALCPGRTSADRADDLELLAKSENPDPWRRSLGH